MQEQGVVQAIPRVFGSLPPCEVFAAPVFDQVLQVQFAADETTENIANFPVVQEQVLVQAIPRLVGSPPPVDEFTAYVARRPLPLSEVRPHSGTSWRISATSHRWCRSSIFLCCGRWTP